MVHLPHLPHSSPSPFHHYLSKELESSIVKPRIQLDNHRSVRVLLLLLVLGLLLGVDLEVDVPLIQFKES